MLEASKMIRLCVIDGRNDVHQMGQLPTLKPAYIDEPVKCPEFGEIESYLFQNRLQLALDRMTWVPENTMYHYIRRSGGLDISVATWRAFLLRCDCTEYLFWWYDLGSGLIHRCPTGCARNYSRSLRLQCTNQERRTVKGPM